MAAKTLRQAEGACLARTMYLVETLPDSLRSQVQLVTWTVCGDPNYRDHWALVWQGAKVLDLTRLQVDGRLGVCFDLDDYPPNFQDRRLYPLSVVPLLNLSQIHTRRLPMRFVLDLRFRMLQVDLGHYRALGQWAPWTRRVLEEVRYSGVQVLYRARRRLWARAVYLKHGVKVNDPGTKTDFDAL